jgi:hypothetical protein
MAFQSSPILNLPRASPGSRVGLLLVTLERPAIRKNGHYAEAKIADRNVGVRGRKRSAPTTFNRLDIAAMISDRLDIASHDIIKRILFGQVCPKTSPSSIARSPMTTRELCRRDRLSPDRSSCARCNSMKSTRRSLNSMTTPNKEPRLSRTHAPADLSRVE